MHPCGGISVLSVALGRRQAAAKYKRDRAKEEKENLKKGRPGDVDFQRKIKEYRARLPDPRSVALPRRPANVHSSIQL